MYNKSKYILNFMITPYKYKKVKKETMNVEIIEAITSLIVVGKAVRKTDGSKVKRKAGT